MAKHGSPKGAWLAAATALVLAVAAHGAAAAAGKTWRHAVIEAKSDAGILMMAPHGFAEAEGLTLDVVQFKSDVIGLQAMLAGDVDSYEGGPTGAVMAASHGADVKIIGCHWPGLPYGVFVRSTIGTPADLKGKTIAISSPGANPDVVARAMLAQYAIPVSEVRFANLGSDLDRFKAVVAGVADATVVSSEYAPIAAKAGIRLLVPARDVVPNFMRLCIFSSGKVLASKQDAAVHFLAAEMKALAYALAHRDETLRLTREITGIKPDDPRPEDFFDDALRGHGVDPTLPLPMDKLLWIEDRMVKDGNLSKPIDLARLVDPDIRAKALALVRQ